MNANRCQWCPDDPLYVAYHDREWGVPVHDDRELFEMLSLQGAQAGLSWLTILKKRDNYRRAFDRFDAAKIARYDQGRIDALLADPGIVRNRLKVASVLRNARGFLRILDTHGSFNAFLWRFVDGRPRQNAFRTLAELPAQTAESDAMGKALKKLDFNFVGPTICYAFMQAAGMVNDHTTDCFRYDEVGALAE